MPRLDHRRSERRPGRGVVWRDWGEESGCRNLGFAPERRALERACRGGQWRSIADEPVSLLESGVVSADDGHAESRPAARRCRGRDRQTRRREKGQAAAAAFLQGGSQPKFLVGHADEVGGWRSDLVPAAPLAGRDYRPDQEPSAWSASAGGCSGRATWAKPGRPARP